ncbi:TonB-dependent receptor [Leeuwenhoekiella sp. MAR_2009_132]|uniref:TonB-dependent receptor n=1 Tax=Leeuwenhoekiella sp. MAR_2009_132 TaxID=1392489 RepID=UPI0004900BC6|nr:TonB-dependent receptor [Leeuwenhoekiella sp. MAR_2009_132]
MRLNRFSNVFLLVLFLVVGSGLMAQSTISGTVKDNAGMALPGVNVILESMSKGSVTDFDGNYTITDVADGSYTILVSYVGFKTEKRAITISGEDVVSNFDLQTDAQSLDQVIVTGVANPRSRIESSVSVTSLKPEVVQQSAPRSTAEIFRTIPGIRSESSGGEGNANIAVRGVPISSGGSKYVQLQEDGLPVLLYGDISFGTADIFTRFDSNVARIEAIRGGSASTLSSNSPGGIINIISKTGKQEGGSVGTTLGLDYSSFRTDFDYGGKIGDGLYMHMGGFYRVGEGVRPADFTANNGGQFKFNITKEFEKGYVRLSAKYLNDRAIAYLPGPVAVTGTNANPEFSDLANFDATRGTLHTPFLEQNVGFGPNGDLRRSKISDGMNPVSTSVGLEASFDLGNDFKIKTNGRFSMNKGRFVSPFPAQVATAGALLGDDFAAANNWSSFQYANGDGAVANDAVLARIHLFDTELNNFNNFMNDIKLTKKLNNLNVTLGFFKSMQNISMSWLWNSYLQEVSDDNARLVNIADAAGNSLSENGLYAYGTPFWGNLHRNYDTRYNVSAPYVNLGFEASEKLNFDASLRVDLGRVDGTFTGGTSRQFDVNNDGIISVPEQNVFAVDNANATTVNYDYDYVSYSVGANLLLTDRQAVFGRYSRGASAKADRILFSGLNYLDGDAINGLDFINQAELGYKNNFEKGALYVTAFYAKTIEEGGFEATSQTIIENDYRSLGLEIEGSYSFEDFSLRGALTYTNAKIDSGDNEGNKPRRQPDFIFNVIPTYDFGAAKQNSVGLSFVGQTKAYAQDSNELILPGFVMVNSFVKVGITESLSANISANNIFDSLGITEAEEGSIIEGQTNFVRARALSGRSLSLSLNYSF